MGSEIDIINTCPNVKTRRNKFITELKYDLNKTKTGDECHELIWTYVKEYARILYEENSNKKYKLDEMDLWVFIK